MESTNINNNQMFLSEFKELSKEMSSMKKRIVQLEESHEKQQEKLNILEKENHALKTQLNINGNKDKEGESALKRKRTEKDQDYKEEPESKSTSVSTGKKKTKTNNNNDDEETVVIPLYDNRNSFDSLSDDLLHKIVDFDGSCYSKFGSINKRCKNIYDMEEYKLKKQTCLFGYGTVDMMLEYYLQKRREGKLDNNLRFNIAYAVIKYSRLDAIDWIIQLGDSELLQVICIIAGEYGRINILSRVFLKSNLTIIDELLDDINMCYQASRNGHLETLKWLRKYGAEWSSSTFAVARRKGHDEIVHYLRSEGCPESPENSDEETTVGSDNEEGDDEDADESLVILQFDFDDE